MRESADDESGMITKLEADLKAVRGLLVQSLGQIDKMYAEIDALKEENLMLRYTVMHNAVTANEVRKILEEND